MPGDRVEIGEHNGGNLWWALELKTLLKTDAYVTGLVPTQFEHLGARDH